MLNDVIHEFSLVGLELNANKCAWIADKHSLPFNSGYDARVLMINDVPVPQSDHLIVLGSVITADSSEEMHVLHRISHA